jgi:hypothetical protein
VKKKTKIEGVGLKKNASFFVVFSLKKIFFPFFFPFCLWRESNARPPTNSPFPTLAPRPTLIRSLTHVYESAHAHSFRYCFGFKNTFIRRQVIAGMDREAF